MEELSDSCRLDICWMLTPRIGWRQVQDHSDSIVWIHLMTDLNSKATGQLGVIGNFNCCGRIYLMWVMGIIKVTKLYRNNGFIKGDPPIDQVSIGFKAETSIVAIGVDRLLIFPAISFFLQGKGKVKVIKIDHQVNAFGLDAFKYLAVKSHSYWIDFSTSFRENPRPLDRSPKSSMPSLD